jgi:hypothetical protein
MTSVKCGPSGTTLTLGDRARPRRQSRGTSFESRDKYRIALVRKLDALEGNHLVREWNKHSMTETSDRGHAVLTASSSQMV